MQKRKMTKFICDFCEKESEKSDSELKRNLKLGRKNYCSRSCVGKDNINSNLPLRLRSNYDITKHSGNTRDQYTGLRSLLRNSKRRYKKELNITLEDLLNLWNKQNGKCAYTGIDLIKPSYNNKNNRIYTASLDRIDSSKGYVPGNIQFVSMAINFMKSDMSHEDTLKLIDLIKSN